MVMLTLLFGCGGGLPIGTWALTLTCDDETDTTAVPACAEGARAIVELTADDPPRGEHLTLLPGVPREGDGGYSGVVGPVTGTWDDAVLALVLVADLDDPLLSDGDRALWADHHLRLAGTPSSRAWPFTWSLVDDEGAAAAAGAGEATRAGTSDR